jgi:uncharacterized protein (DUF2141 family)
MKHKFLYSLLIIGILLQQCAKQTAPTGGPMDETPPTMLRSNPTHKEINFKGTEVQLTFDEFVQLNNPREQILITPSIGKKFEAIAKKNKVIIELNSKLSDTTTYTFNFRESVQDLTEKNPAKIKLAFSTGAHIDSLTIAGTIKDILTDKSLNNFTVALTPALDTFNIFKHAAPWVTLADKQGRFVFENLKHGDYFLYAFDDKNKNLVADSKSEKYGFKSDNIQLQGPVDSIRINAFKLDAAKLKLISSRPTFAYYNIRLSKSVVNYKLSAADSLEKIHSILEPDLTTIKVYNTIPALDSLQIRLEAIDSTESKVDTLIYIKFKGAGSTRDSFTGKIDRSTIYESNSTLSAVISFTKPVTHFIQDSLFVQLDSINRINFTKNDLTWNENLTTLTISKKVTFPNEDVTKPKMPLPQKKLDLEQESNPARESTPFNQLILKAGSVISIENDTLSGLTSPLKRIKIQDYGIISAAVSTKENFILQLLDQKNKVIQEVKNITKFNFENLPAGLYMLRLLIDLNKNGKWDGGDYATKKQPEPVVYYRTPKGGRDTILKANWVVGELLITY